jgi:hypothetical protein
MVYQFRNKKTGKIVDIVMSMKDYKPYRGESGNDDFWERIYDVPQVNLGDAKVVDPFDNTEIFWITLLNCLIEEQPWLVAKIL